MKCSEVVTVLDVENIDQPSEGEFVQQNTEEYACCSKGMGMCACYYKDCCPRCIVKFMHLSSFADVKPSEGSSLGVFATKTSLVSWFTVSFWGKLVKQQPENA